MATMKTYTTIVINWGYAPIPYRLAALPFTILKPLADVPELIAEYHTWKKGGAFPSSYQRFRFIVDHSILWLFYCIKAVFMGDVMGYSWEIEEGKE